MNRIVLTALTLVLIGILPKQLKAQSVGGVTSGSAAYCAANNSGFVTLNGHTGTILFWQSSTNSGATWTNISNPTASQSYVNLTQTTDYRAVVKDGAFPEDTSTISTITIHPPAVGGTISGAGAFCVNSGTGTLNLSGEVGNVLNWLVSTNNGSSWTTIGNTTNTLNHPNITQNTLYAAVVENVATCPTDTSMIASFTIDPLTVTGAYLDNDSIICSEVNEDTLHLVGNTGNVIDWLSSTNNGSTWISLGNTGNTEYYSGLTQTTWYKTVVQSGVCSGDTTPTVKLTVMLPNPVEAGDDEDIVQFETVTLNGAGIGTPFWSPSEGLDDPNLFNPEAKPLKTTKYIITLTDSNYCVSYDSVTINVDVPIPNAITPNGDGANDFFIINKIDSFPGNTLEIYNRYGSLIFSESPYVNSWGGQSNGGGDLPDGIYYYNLDYGDGRETVTGYILIKR